MKLSTAISYRFKYQMKSGAFFFGYFLLFSVGMPLFALLFSNSTNSNINSDALFASMIFMFILAFIGVSSDFKLFIQNGMSRFNIFLSSIISNFILSLCLSTTVFIVRSVINNVLNVNFKLTIFFVEFYTKDNSFNGFVLMVIFFLLASSLGSLTGTFNDRVSNFMKLFIIATLVLIPTVFMLILNISSMEFRLNVLEFIQTILGIDANGFNPLPLALTLLSLYLIFSIITYLMNIHREIKRVNA